MAAEAADQKEGLVLHLQLQLIVVMVAVVVYELCGLELDPVMYLEHIHRQIQEIYK